MSGGGDGSKFPKSECIAFTLSARKQPQKKIGIVFAVHPSNSKSAILSRVLPDSIFQFPIKSDLDHCWDFGSPEGVDVLAVNGWPVTRGPEHAADMVAKAGDVVVLSVERGKTWHEKGNGNDDDARVDVANKKKEGWTTEKRTKKNSKTQKRSADEEYDCDTLIPTGKKPKTAPNPSPSWEQMFFQLVLYSAKNGTCQVPKKHLVDIYGESMASKSVDLGRFASQLRQYRRIFDSQTASARVSVEKATSILTLDRIAALDKIGFIWNLNKEGGISTSNHLVWEEHYNELKAHHAEHGNCKPVKNSSLEKWCDTQRAENNAVLGTTVRIGASARKGMGYGEEPKADAKKRLSIKQSAHHKGLWEKRKAKLDELDFIWSSKRAKRISWEDRFEILKLFKAQNGHCDVPQHYPLNKSLGKWCNRQRNDYLLHERGQKGPMTEERIAHLESVGFKWVFRKRISMANTPDEEDDDNEDGVNQSDIVEGVEEHDMYLSTSEHI